MREVLQAIGQEHAVEFTIDPEVQGTVTTSFTNLPLKEGLRRLAGSYALLFMREPASGRESLLRVAVLQEGEAQALSSEPATSQETIRAPPKGRSRVPTFPTAKRVIGGVLREEEKDVEFAPNEVLVKLKDDAPEGAIDDVVLQLDAIILKQYGAIGYYRLELSAQTSVAEAIAELEANQLVEVVEPNYIVHADLQPNDPSLGQLWGLHNTGQTGGAADADIDAPEAWDTQRGSTSVVVAVIDTGVDYNHPDLAANMWTNSGEVPGNGIDDDNNGYVDDYRGWDFYNNDNDPYDDHRHGTHVAGTIAAVGDNGVGVVGVNWTSRIMPLKFLSGGGSGYISDAVEAVLYAAANGAKVMNNSWGGGGYSSALYSAIQTANSAGSLFIAAAGNSSNNNDAIPYYPTNYNVANVVSVAASTSSDTLAYFSSYGANTVDLAAPGVGILSTVPGGGYSSFSGTSMATPHVAGAAALLMAQFPSSSHLEIRALMMDSVDPVGAFAGITITGGRLNVFTPLGCQSNTLTVSGLTPSNGATIALSESMTVSARVTACGGAVNGATVSAAFSTGGPALALFDDGAHNDGAAGDGLFGASWAPGTEGSVSLTVTASASGYTSGSASTTFNVLRIIVYQYNDAYTYQWIDATQGIDTGIQGDDTSAVVDLRFSFDFYEVAHTQVRVSSNGYLTFGNNGTRYVNDPIPSSGTPNDLIAPFWDDLNPSAGGAIYLLRSGAAPNRSVTVQWHNVPHYSNTGAVTFQVTLYEGSNDIVFRYKDVTFDNSSYDDGASATVGVEAPTGSFGTQYSTNSATLSAGKAINFYFSPPVLSVSPTGTVDFGTVAVGESADRSFTVTNTGGGTLTGTVST
ncbi:MAG: S8 family peptidase, partial [bacterium]|nr:S8 family peptidase [bacterium]